MVQLAEPLPSRSLSHGGAGASAAVRALAEPLRGPVPSPALGAARRPLSASRTHDATALFSEALSGLRVGSRLVLTQGLCRGCPLRREPPSPRCTAPSRILPGLRSARCFLITPPLRWHPLAHPVLFPASTHLAVHRSCQPGHSEGLVESQRVFFFLLVVNGCGTQNRNRSNL